MCAKRYTIIFSIPRAKQTFSQFYLTKNLFSYNEEVFFKFNYMTTGINGGDLTGAPENPNRRNFLKASAALATVGVVGKAAAEACNANGTTPCVLTLPNGAPTTLNLGLNQEQSSQGVYITL